MSNLQELEQDLQELEQFLKSATRNRTKKLLEEDVSQLKLLIENEKKNAPQPIPKETSEEAKKQSAESELFNPITKYAWDQEGKNVKIYITLDDIGKLSPSNIKFEVTKETVELKIYQYKNASWRFSIKKTHSPLNTEKCKFTQKTNSINITLVKETDGYWSQLAYKESSFKPEKLDKEKDQDPSASLMNMMKKLYEEGDDEMKKTIAQAWTKSQDDKNKPH